MRAAGLMTSIALMLLYMSCTHHANSDHRPIKPVAVIDKKILEGFDVARWNYYCYYSALGRHIVDKPLESYDLHPTIFDLEMASYKVNGDSITYLVRRRFVSSKYPCVEVRDSLEMAVNTANNSLCYIKESGRDLIIKTTFENNVRIDSGAAKEIDSFLRMHLKEVNPWFRNEVKARHFLENRHRK